MFVEINWIYYNQNKYYHRVLSWSFWHSSFSGRFRQHLIWSVLRDNRNVCKQTIIYIVQIAFKNRENHTSLRFIYIYIYIYLITCSIILCNFICIPVWLYHCQCCCKSSNVHLHYNIYITCVKIVSRQHAFQYWRGRRRW